VLQFSYSKSPTPPSSRPLTKTTPLPDNPSDKKPRDLNFERRHAMFATPHVKATLFVFCTKAVKFFLCVLHRASKVKVPRQKFYYFFLFYIITCVQFWSKNHFFSFLLKIHLPFPHNNVTPRKSSNFPPNNFVSMQY